MIVSAGEYTFVATGQRKPFFHAGADGRFSNCVRLIPIIRPQDYLFALASARIMPVRILS